MNRRAMFLAATVWLFIVCGIGLLSCVERLHAASHAVTIARLPLSENVRITVSPGAVGACTVYQQQVVGVPDSNFPDGRYAPKHCLLLSGPLEGGYEDDWDWIERTVPPTPWLVWSEVQYENDDPTKDFITIKSNVVEFVR